MQTTFLGKQMQELTEMGYIRILKVRDMYRYYRKGALGKVPDKKIN